MRDPAPPPPAWLVELTKPWAQKLYLESLPYHIHEVIFAFVLYQGTQSLVSPALSTYFFPSIYPNLNKRTRVNWDIHVVSLLQACLINALALWVMFNDEERKGMKASAIERVYGYTGAGGLVQALGAGYFVWDLVVSTRYIKIFGIGIWMHAVTALSVFSLGFRPFANFYAPVFILYELSTTFLNIHWFCDKVNMTGSRLQWFNGMILIGTFFCCRLVWGTYSSLRVYQDVWHTMHINSNSPVLRSFQSTPKTSVFSARNGELCLGETACLYAQSEVMQFTGDHTEPVPVWLAGIYLFCNLTLNSLNFYWFGKMIETVRKRFDGSQNEPKTGKMKRRPTVVEEIATELDRDELSGPRTPYEEKTEAMATGVETKGDTKRRA